MTAWGAQVRVFRLPQPSCPACGHATTYTLVEEGEPWAPYVRMGACGHVWALTELRPWAPYATRYDNWP